MIEWPKVTLNSITEKIIDNRGKTPPTVLFGKELLEVNAIGNRSPDYSVIRKYVTEETYANWFRSGHPRIGDILVPTVGTIGNVSIMIENRGAIAQNLIALRFSKDADPDFVYYYLSCNEGKNILLNLDIGGVQPSIKVPHLLAIEVPSPPLFEQRAIAAVLSSLDDKIDLLHRQNKTLEAMAETLFRKWFTEEEAENWKEGKVGDIVTVLSGTTPRTDHPEYWNGEFYWTSPRDITNIDGLFLFDTERKITQKGLDQISSGLLPKSSLLMSSRAPVGVLAFSEIPVAINQGYAGIVCDKGYSREFIYLWLKANMDYIQSHANGSTFQEISKSTFRNLKITIPSKIVLSVFQKSISPLFDKNRANCIQIKALNNLRDTLLPKLMSGEVRVEV